MYGVPENNQYWHIPAKLMETIMFHEEFTLAATNLERERILFRRVFQRVHGGPESFKDLGHLHWLPQMFLTLDFQTAALLSKIGKVAFTGSWHKQWLCMVIHRDHWFKYKLAGPNGEWAEKYVKRIRDV